MSTEKNQKLVCGTHKLLIEHGFTLSRCDQSYLPNKITKKTNLLCYEPQNLFLQIAEQQIGFPVKFGHHLMSRVKI